MINFVGSLLGCVLVLAACSSDNFTPMPSGDAGADSQGKSDGAAKDASPLPPVFDDAGLPCPGATISHPSDNDTRNLGSDVPFTGSGRDAKCRPLIEGSLVWTDSLGGQIGTGGTFVYAFTNVGMRTITLTATDSGGGSAKATITLTIK